MTKNGPEIDSGGPTDSGGSQGGSSDSTVMLILSYVWVLCLIPLVSVKDDPEVQWHAKNGTVLFGAGFGLAVIFMFLNIFTGPLACIIAPIGLLVWLALIVLHIFAIVKAVNGDRLVLPLISDFAEKL